MKVLITGGNGQLGLALQEVFPDNIPTDQAELDITDAAAVKNFKLDGVEAIINAAAYTNVDGCEQIENAPLCWDVNVQGVINLAARAGELCIPFVHVSTDYVFDGTKSGEYLETDIANPLSVYGKSKFASELAASFAHYHYIVRTSWVIGEGKNFVRTMLGLAEKGMDPTVVGDQIGRPTFTTTLAEAIKLLLEKRPEAGVYNVSNSGSPVSWADFTREIFKASGFSDRKVTDTTTEKYFADKPDAAPRPKNSVLNLDKIQSVGFKTNDWKSDLKKYLKKEIA